MRGAYARRDNPKSRKTWGQAAYEWLDKWDGKDFQRQKISVENLLPYIGGDSLNTINNASFAQFKEDRKALAASTINKDIGIATRVIKFACEILEWHDYIPVVLKVKGPTKQPHPFTWDEQDAFFAAFKDQWWAEGPMLFAVNTGARMGEVMSLKWAHMQHIHSLGTFVFVVDGKNGQERALIVNSLGRLAVERQNGGEYVFRKPGRHDWARPCSTAWRKAGLPDDPRVKKGPHNLRHTFGLRLRFWEVPEEDRNLLLGHANASLAQHYAHAAVERLTAQAELVTKRKEITILRSVRQVS